LIHQVRVSQRLFLIQTQQIRCLGGRASESTATIRLRIRRHRTAVLSRVMPLIARQSGTPATTSLRSSRKAPGAFAAVPHPPPSHRSQLASKKFWSASVGNSVYNIEVLRRRSADHVSLDLLLHFGACLRRTFARPKGYQSANTLAKALGADTEIGKVTSTVKLQAVFDAFAKGKRCCKTIVIVSHGGTNGALDMPYDLPKADELPERDKGMARELGGPAGKTGWGGDRLDEFAKAVKKLFCPDLKPAVSFDGCYTAKEGGIAEQVAARGIGTTGYTGSCDFGYLENETTREKKWPGPRPKEGTSSQKKSYPPK